MQNSKQAKFIYLFLLIQPIIDILTSFMVRYGHVSLTIGMLLRGGFLLISLIYLIFYSKSKYKKTSLIYLGILFIYFLFYFFTKKELLAGQYLFTEIKYSFKYFYFPVITACIINVYDEFNLQKEKIFKIFIIDLIIYAIFILVPEALGLSFNSYTNNYKGAVGWFYAANEIGAILVLLFPYLYYFVFKRESIIKTSIIFILVIISITILGTKTSFFGLLIAEILYLIYFLCHRKQNRGLGFKMCLILILLSFVVIPQLPAVKNLQNSIIDVNAVEEDKDNEDEIVMFPNNQFLDKVIKVVYSGRQIFCYRVAKIYKSAPLSDKIFGLGFVNRPAINNKHIEKLVEIDLFDIFFHYGILGFIIYFIPLLYIIIRTLVLIFQKKFAMSFFKMTNMYVILIMIVVSSIAGHVLGAPAVSIYLSFTVAMFNSALDKQVTKGEKETGKKKITIFALHLGYGGVEKYISSLCKMLEDNYQIEIISTYKVSDKPAFEFSNKIKITYLINDKPNRKEFKKALHDKKIIAIFDEGFKAVKLLYLKRARNIKAIRNTYSDYIITTRIFHNKLVGSYAYKDIIKIATEHNYHNNSKKYIYELLDSIKDFDYFVPVSKDLRDFYKDKTNVEVVYIPNVIDTLPKNKSKLTENNIINVGRFEVEKGQEDLIDIVKKIKKEIPDIKLYLIGDGSLKNKLHQKVEEENLKDNIIFTGFISKEELEKYYLKSKLFVMTSYTESFGLVLIEAMSYSVPCIAYDCANGAKNLLSNDIGILIKDRNKEEMVKKIIALLKDNKKLKEYSDKGYKECQKYLSKNVKEMWNDLLERKYNDEEKKAKK